MKKLRVALTAAVVLATVIGFSGTAEAQPRNLLNNPGAEAGVLDPWTSDNLDAGNVFNNLDLAQDGVWFFATDLVRIAPETSVTIQQDVDVTGCGVEGLDGFWEANGFVATDIGPDDTGQLAVMLDDASSATSLVVKDTQGVYVEMGPISGPISAAATNAKVSIIGTNIDLDGLATVRFDDISFGITCVTDFAKISGKIIGTGGKGRGGRAGNDRSGRAGQYSFDGTVGHMDDGAQPGSIDINYKTLGTVCTFTQVVGPDAILYDVVNGTARATVMADYECVGGENDGDGGTATIVLVQGAGGPEGRGKLKDRGSVCVDADLIMTDPTELDIGTTPGVCTEGNELDLGKGNVKVSPVAPTM